jgi:hypothetical protein
MCHQEAPLPSMVPSPVMETLVALTALTSAWWPDSRNSVMTG